MRTVQMLTATIVAGILSAFLFVGVGGRAALKAIAFVSGRDVSFTIEGTFAALVFSTSLGVVAGLIFRLVHSFLPGSPSAKGGAFGLVLFIVLIPFLPDAVREEAVALGDHIPLAITVFGLLLMGFGVVLEAMARTLAEISCRQESVVNEISYDVQPNLTTQSTNHNNTSRRVECKLCESLP